MNPLIRRLLALAGSVVVGLFGAIVFASPAQAHHPIITGIPRCEPDGRYRIDWTVENGNWFGRFMKIVAVDPTPDATFTNITVGTWLDPNGKVYETQFVPGTTTTATLYINAKWYRSKRPNAAVRVEANRTATVTMSETCQAEPNPSASFSDKCDGTVTARLVNPTSSTKTFRLQGTNLNEQVTVTSAEGHKDFPVPAGAGTVTVSVQTTQGWTTIDTHTWTRKDCPPPEVASDSTCTEFSIAVTNPTGSQTVKTKITYGTQVSEPEWTEVKAGETKNFKFTPSGASEAKIEFTNDWPSETVKYVKPTTCETLPQTGSDTSTLIASGAGLAMLGGLAFFFARRRMAQLRKLAAS